MRITDLARKLGIPTERLRLRLEDFAVAKNAREIPTNQGLEIFEKLKNQTQEEPLAEEPEQELMGMVFEEEEETKEVPPEKDSAKEVCSAAQEKTETTTAKTVQPQTAAKKQEEARLRWARAKRASERILRRVVKKMDKEAVKRSTRKKEKLEEAIQGKTEIRSATALIKVPEAISVRELAGKMGISPIKVLGELLRNGFMANINQIIDFETATLIAENFGCKVERDLAAVSSQDLLKGNIEKLLVDDEAKLKPRPPIVVILGHVDHGKTTLLDAIRKTNVVAGEAGGITQHIGAYEIEHAGRLITFLDTPGHEAFTAMRARGARVTDIAVLVVAAEEGIKPQTLEAIDHARAAEVPIIVAITKTDKPGANIEKVKGELAEHDLNPTDWGGSTEVVPVSAPEKKGIKELLDLILLVNDVNPVKANPERAAVGTVIESYLDRSLGPVVSVLINTGTLRMGDNFIIGQIMGRVKKIFDYNKKVIKEVKPGQPAQIVGSESLPENVGEILQVLPSSAAARLKVQEIRHLQEVYKTKKITGLTELITQINAGKLKELRIVVKADVEGSLEALRENLKKLGNEEVKVKIIHFGVGAVNETDVLMAAAADGLLIAFHTKVTPAAEKIAQRERVSIRRHTIIYQLMEEVEKMLSGLLDPEEHEVELGELIVKGVFFTKNAEQIVGGLVKTGKLLVGANLRILRAGKLIGESKIESLKREKENAKEVREGFECGVKLNLKDLKVGEGDVLQVWQMEKRKREL